MIDPDVESLFPRRLREVDRVRFHVLVFVIAHDDHHHFVPARPESLDHVAEDGVGGATLVQYLRCLGAVKMAGGVDFVELNHDEVGVGRIEGVEGFEDGAIGSESEATPQGSFGQLPLRRPVDLGLAGSADSHQVLIPEGRHRPAAPAPAVIEEGRDRIRKLLDEENSQ